jgi:hypothetical protein
MRNVLYLAVVLLAAVPERAALRDVEAERKAMAVLEACEGTDSRIDSFASFRDLCSRDFALRDPSRPRFRTVPVASVCRCSLVTLRPSSGTAIAIALPVADHR